jgi:hypothetical protein
MDNAQVIISQYHASLAMLEDAVVKCPDALWDAPKPPNRFYQIAYHALFYTHLYLQPTHDDFKLWENHIEGHQSFGQPGYPDASEPPGGDPYTKDDILEYLEFCRNEVNRIVPTLDFQSESGFDWLPFGKLELQFYSIRHIQLHVGELAERLSASQGIEVGWVGMGSTDSE